ncbi:MAG: TlpA family protein disulfide reductase [Chloroflexi bacterium]|nr:TlpA family protein disulfide reductase [Chloroflexota bacterium]
MKDPNRRRVWALLGSGLLIWAAILGGAWLLPRLISPPDSELRISGRAPDFELETTAGTTVRLSELRGQPVVINFWATWCGPCVIEMPNFQKYYEDIYPGKFIVLAVNADEEPVEVKRYTEAMGLTFDILLDPGGLIQELYQIRGYPTTYFVDAKGIVQAQAIGGLDEDQLADYLRQVGVGQ